MKTLKTQVVIVGSGSAGLSAGFELYQKKIPFIMLERGDKVAVPGSLGPMACLRSTLSSNSIRV